LISETAADCRDIMIEGESGILACSPPWFRPHYEPSKRRLTWPNGAVATAYSAEEPDQLRGPGHDGAWCDELAKWAHLHRRENAWSNLMFGLTLGADPRCIVTTTPRPLALLKEIRESPTTSLVTGHMRENLPNLSPVTQREIIDRYEGTRLGLQELAGQELEDVEGALWDRITIDEYRVSTYPPLAYVVVGVDPEATDTETSSETGIVGAGLGDDGEFYILRDGTRKGSPHEWATAAISVFSLLEADRIIAEVNQGGDMVASTLRTVDQRVPIRKVHASRGKRTRAEPIAALYEQGRVHHVGFLPELEEQLCTWDGTGTSPDRLDALVWAMTELSSRRIGKLPDQQASAGRTAGLPAAVQPASIDGDGSGSRAGSRLAGLPGRVRGG
jgi:phage terminase large subunit-like protein